MWNRLASVIQWSGAPQLPSSASAYHEQTTGDQRDDGGDPSSQGRVAFEIANRTRPTSSVSGTGKRSPDAVTRISFPRLSVPGERRGRAQPGHMEGDGMNKKRLLTLGAAAVATLVLGSIPASSSDTPTLDTLKFTQAVFAAVPEPLDNHLDPPGFFQASRRSSTPAAPTWSRRARSTRSAAPPTRSSRSRTRTSRALPERRRSRTRPAWSATRRTSTTKASCS
jgi:hypothetical protein